ncbi:MAG: ROK family protein [Candidatus Omnitrophica bacterium]|nr:ROK family protein [Candidatus Omnitrophota bacterium]
MSTQMTAHTIKGSRTGLTKIVAGVSLCAFVLTTACPAFGLSVAINAYNERLEYKNDVERLKQMDPYEETLRREYRYLSVRIGGTNLTVAVLDGHNRILTVNNIKWEWVFPRWRAKRDRKTDANAQAVIDETIKLIMKTLNNANNPRIEHIALNVAGPVDKDFGLVGTDFPSPSLPFNNFPIVKQLNEGLARHKINASIDLANDTEASVNGETLTPRGLLHRHQDGCAVIIGTGMNIGVKKNGAYYMGEQNEIREAGHKIIQMKADDGSVHFEWVGDRVGTYHPIEKGRTVEKIKQKSRDRGMKYIADPQLFEEKYPDFPIIDYEAGLRDLEDIISGEHIGRRLRREKAPYTVVTVTDAALRGNEKLKEKARAEIRSIARDIGKGLAAFIAAYGQEAFVEHIVLCSSVAENLGRGVYEKAGDEEDIFMTTLREALVDELTGHFHMPIESAGTIAAGVQRSGIDFHRELMSHVPTIREMESLKALNRNYAVREQEFATERAQIEDMLQRIDLDLAKRGTGDLPKKIVMSDFHGASDMFFAYIADAIARDTGLAITLDHDRFATGVSIKEQLAEQGIYDLKARINFMFYLLGDFSDRGTYGLRCFLAAWELHELGVAKIVMGNHDILWLLAAMGYHLPIYQGYNIYPEYGHERSAQLLAEHNNEFPSFDVRFKEWSKRLHFYRNEQAKMQTATVRVDGSDVSIADILTRTRALFDEVKDDLTKEERVLFSDLIGKNVSGVDVWTGFRACGQMSDQWWDERCALVKKWSTQFAPADKMYRVWNTVYEYTESTTALFKQQLKRMNERYWWWQVFNDINHMNYISPEWAALDWLYHAGWGPNLLKELNEIEADPRIVWDQTNFMDHPAMRKFVEFNKANFSLSIKDEYWNRYTHGWFPFDEETGRIEITYKGITYRDQQIWGLLELLENDIRTADSLTDVQEAWRLIMSWYADNTVKIKPIHIRRAIENVGLPNIFRPLEMRILFNGHNPQNELLKQDIGLMVFDDLFAAVFTDKGMMRKYKDLGCYIEVSGNGIKAYGFNTPQKKKIVENPHTITLGSDDEILSGKANFSLSRNDYFNTVVEQLRAIRDRMLDEEEAGRIAVLQAA